MFGSLGIDPENTMNPLKKSHDNFLIQQKSTGNHPMFVGAPKKNIAPPETELVEHFLFPNKTEVLRFLANCFEAQAVSVERLGPEELEGTMKIEAFYFWVLEIGCLNKMGRKKIGFHLGCFPLQQLEKLCVFAFFAHPENVQCQPQVCKIRLKKSETKHSARHDLTRFFWGHPKRVLLLKCMGKNRLFWQG